MTDSKPDPVILASKILEGKCDRRIGKELNMKEKEIPEVLKELPLDLNMKVEKAFESLLQTSLTDFKFLRDQLLVIIKEKVSENVRLGAIKTLLKAETELVNILDKIRIKREEDKRKPPARSVWYDVYERAKANNAID